MEFWTTLIQVTGAPTIASRDALRKNCTHVAGPYWIMEGDVDYLRDEGVHLLELAEGAVSSLGDLSPAELKQVCLRSFRVWIP